MFTRASAWTLVGAIIVVYGLQGIVYTSGSYHDPWFIVEVIGLSVVLGLVCGTILYRMLHPPRRAPLTMMVPRWTADGLPPPGSRVVTCQACGTQGVAPDWVPNNPVSCSECS